MNKSLDTLGFYEYKRSMPMPKERAQTIRNKYPSRDMQHSRQRFYVRCSSRVMRNRLKDSCNIKKRAALIDNEH